MPDSLASCAATAGLPPTLPLLLLYIVIIPGSQLAPTTATDDAYTWEEDAAFSNSSSSRSLSYGRDFSCLQKPDGIYKDPYSDSQYFRCMRHTIVEHMMCEYGFHFDQVTQQCKQAAETDNPCSASGDGFFITPGSLCKSYYSCRSGVKQDYTCPQDSYFDLNSEICVRSGGICHELICTGRVNGHYADTTHGCRRYYVCEGGSLQTVMGCPRGRLYDGNTCRPAALVNCPSADTSSLVLRLPATDQCSDLPNGFHSQNDDDTCRGYVFCHNQQTIAKLRCPPGEHFNGNKCAPSSTANPCFSFCNGKQNGYYADLRKHCKEYVKCVDGNIAEHKTCNDGMLYDGKTCMSSVLYKCPSFSKSNSCTGMRNGYHTDYLTNCREYFYCHEEQTLLRSACAGGKVWNGSHCVLPYEFMCDGPELWPSCSGLQDGLYPDLSRKSRCQQYYYCQQGLRIRLSCSVDKVFDGRFCVPKKEFSCPVTDDDCHQSPDGYYVDHRSGCRSYYYCSNGNKVSYLCPDDLIFNGKECVGVEQYICPSETKECENKINGYHGDRASGCHSYMYCLKGKKIATFTCPINQVFDGKQCVPFMLNNCMSNSMSSTCTAQPDGYYTEPHSHCMKYFQCVNNKRTKSFTCPTGKIFNGAKCVDYSCPEQSENLIINCDETSMGFFQDFSSDCKKYFFCINGVKTSLSCGQGLLFNGELCVSKDSYTCPSSHKHNITSTLR